MGRTFIERPLVFEGLEQIRCVGEARRRVRGEHGVDRRCQELNERRRGIAASA